MNGPHLLVTGCYTPEMNGHGSGLTSYRRDPDDGSLTPLDALALPSPSYVIQHPSLPVLYTANEAGEEGTVSAVAIGADGSLRELARVSSRGGSPCHLAVGGAGRRLGVANYGSGTTLLLDLDETGLPDGVARLWQGDPSAVGPRADRQDAPHAHMAVPGPAGLWHVVDLGTDQLLGFHADDPGTADGADPTVTALPAGAGPRQLVRGTDGTAYVVGELDSRLYALSETGPGAFEVLGSVAASAAGTESGNYPAHLTVSEDGARLYLSNRGADTVALFRTVPGGLPRFEAEYPSGGSWPRHMELAGDHLYVSNERGDNLAVHAVDPGSGALTLLHRQPAASPTCAVAVRLG
ncbi:lactonase family protein [Streptacidiphilus anmyonensis]|uniref:lactonase family protein n=1 Tax=Streptacidiphilus anmyonensis TaxID=405782 RepID=UPI000694AA58|nr:lactonase family protein [Streptacidiphilus anmyonensis]